MLKLCMKAWIADILLENSMFHCVFVHWAAWMAILGRLSSNFFAAGTNNYLEFSLFLLTFCDQSNWL